MSETTVVDGQAHLSLSGQSLSQYRGQLRWEGLNRINGFGGATYCAQTSGLPKVTPDEEIFTGTHLLRIWDCYQTLAIYWKNPKSSVIVPQISKNVLPMEQVPCGGNNPLEADFQPLGIKDYLEVVFSSRELTITLKGEVSLRDWSQCPRSIYFWAIFEAPSTGLISLADIINLIMGEAEED